MDETAAAAVAGFSRLNIFAAPLVPAVAHGGKGEVNAVRLATGTQVSTSLHFVDYVTVPPGASIGDHRHADDEEEYYLILAGNGLMRLDDQQFDVTCGDLVRNRPGGVHGLINTGTEQIKLFIFEIEAD